MPDDTIENRTFDEMRIGDSAHAARLVTRRDIELFAVVSGDANPAHLDESFARDDRFRGIVAHGLLGGAFISAVLGNKLPGPGTIYLEQDLKFHHPVRPGDTIDVTVTVREKDAARKVVVLDCLCANQNKQPVISGRAHVLAPTEKIRRAAIALPEVEIVNHDRLDQLITRTKGLPPLRTAVVHPCDAVSLQGADAAARAGLIVPVLIGPEDKIRSAALAAGIQIGNYEIVAAPHSHVAAAQAVALAREGKVGALMKGSLHTDELMGAVVSRDGGLRTDKRMSHVFVVDVPSYKWPLLITDAALNIAPTLEDKRCICQNAIDLAHDLGLADPKVALLAATEEVNTTMPATLEAAALCKMASRGQITGATLDGPLAFDNAISVEAARIKHIISPVAGHADILMVPNIEAGNMLAKQLGYLAAAEMAGLVIGARVPIILTSRADNAHARLASAALAVLSAEGERKRLAAKAAAAKG